MHDSRGSTRFLLIAALATAAVLLVASVLVIVNGDDPATDDGGGIERPFVPGAPRADRGQRSRVDSGEEGDEEDDDYDWTDGLEGSREPFGDVFAVTPESLRQVLADRHWEEIRRQIDVLQRDGKEVPEDVVQALLALLDGEDTRIDAVLALGQVKSDAAGLALALRAADSTLPDAVRAAALQAIAANGSPVALVHVRTLVESAAAGSEGDTPVFRAALRALAGIGGADASRTLVDALGRHADDDLSGAIVDALARTRGAGEVLAQTLRTARDAGDSHLAGMVVTVAQIHGTQAEPALRAEVRRLVEDPTASEFAGDEHARLVLRGSAIAAAAAIGGELLGPVVRIASENPDGLGGIALHSLRQSRGDDAANAILPLLDAPGLERSRREVLEALGETRSPVATETLLRYLDADDVNLRDSASRGLGLVRDASAVQRMLQKLSSKEGDYVVKRNLVDALGTICAQDALPTLRALAEAQGPEADSLRMFVRRAIQRIESGNPDSTLMAPDSRR